MYHRSTPRSLLGTENYPSPRGSTVPKVRLRRKVLIVKVVCETFLNIIRGEEKSFSLSQYAASYSITVNGACLPKPPV